MNTNLRTFKLSDSTDVGDNKLTGHTDAQSAKETYDSQ